MILLIKSVFIEATIELVETYLFITRWAITLFFYDDEDVLAPPRLAR
jgi:hypothetical protein